MLINKLAIIRGAGDIATGIAHRLYKSGFKVIMLEIDKPSVIRRKVAFAEAIYENEFEVEGVRAKRANNTNEVNELINNNIIPILIDTNGKSIIDLKPDIVVDAILAKKNLGTNREMANIVIGVGPGFVAEVDVDAVVESNRGHNLGKVILEGSTEANTGIPGNIIGFTEERVLRGNNNGCIKVIKDIGSFVKKGEAVAEIEGTLVRTKLNGVVRGMIRDGYEVTMGMKIGDVDPRGRIEYCDSISDKARAVGGGVLEAALHFLNK